MLIFVLNCGSSSVKYQLIHTETEESLARGSVDRIGMSSAQLSILRSDGYKAKFEIEILDHTQAIEQILNYLQHKEHGVIKDKSEVEAVGHRVVHGGQQITESVLIDDKVLTKIRQCIELAPLHNPHNLRGINAAMQNLPGIPQVAVFDTAFHSSIPPKAFLYALPYVFYLRDEIRRYGFHGTSHFYVARRAEKLCGGDSASLKIITAHLGNGCSITAVKGGKSIDTSMGLTPLEGLVMGTRCGDIDPSIILQIMGREGLTLNEANSLLNKHSGLQGLSGTSSDVRDLLEKGGRDDERVKLAIDVYCYRMTKYIGAYAAALGGLDALVFTAGVGENSPLMRGKICEGLEFMGIELDEEANQKAVGKEMLISRKDGRVKVFAIPTNEELVIARDTEKIVNESRKKG
ncbi:MAG: acetate kinase [Candidatus Glassbacteria bacterium]|nr:acetate kinase [Candidatus Glassbacteria bacterium]